MSEMTECPEIFENAIENPPNSDNELETSKILQNIEKIENIESVKIVDKSGDWNKIADAWINSREILPKEISSFDGEKSIELKYKNLYSMSSPNCNSSLIPWDHVASTPAKYENKSDESLKESESYIDVVREYLANYQESYGTPRSEYSFGALIRLMGQATGRSLLVLFYIVVNITPMVQIFLYVLRFVLDKIINIRKTNDCQQVIVKYAILGLQLLCIYVCLVFTFGFIVIPIVKMVMAIFLKIIL